jgi:predicted phosphodiesterase
VLADTHGNLPALEAVLADVDARSVDGFIVAGDITGGPHAQETISLLRSLDSCMIRGNGEEYLLEYHTGQAPDSWYTDEQWATLRWSYQRLDREVLALIARLPVQRIMRLDGTAPIRIVHGTPWSTRQFLYPDADPVVLDTFRRAGLLPHGHQVPQLMDILCGVEESVLVCAHSHIPWIQESERLLVVNPGSVGAPNNGDARAQYAQLTWEDGRWHAVLQAVDYDLDRVRAGYRDSGLLAAGGVMAEAFLLGIVTGENVPGCFVASVRRLAAEAGYEPGARVPDDVWWEAIAGFDWGVGQAAMMHYLDQRESLRVDPANAGRVGGGSHGA